ncbi:MAG: hypothetical protein K9J03_01915 [Candidatus Methylopumilus sp.]|nr:hypothetical protein [Candidatus Methylopumilus sp.]
MTAIEKNKNTDKSAEVQKTPSEIAKFILDSSYIFNGWLIALTLLCLTLIFNFYLDGLKYLIAAALLFVYLWFMLIAKLDQLASSIGIKSSTVYKTQLIPVIGTIVCYLNVIHLAIQLTNKNELSDN